MFVGKKRKYFHYGILLLGLILLGILPACQQKSQENSSTQELSSEQKTTANNQTVKLGDIELRKYQAPSANYEVLMPLKWRKVFNDKANAIWARSTQGERIEIMLLRASQLFNDGKTEYKAYNVKEYGKNVIENLVSKTLDFKLIQNDNYTNVSPQQNGLLSYSAKDTEKNKTVYVLEWLSTDGKHGANIRYRSFEAFDDKQKELFQEICKSFEFK